MIISKPIYDTIFNKIINSDCVNTSLTDNNNNTKDAKITKDANILNVNFISVIDNNDNNDYSNFQFIKYSDIIKTVLTSNNNNMNFIVNYNYIIEDKLRVLLNVSPSVFETLKQADYTFGDCSIEISNTKINLRGMTISQSIKYTKDTLKAQNGEYYWVNIISDRIEDIINQGTEETWNTLKRFGTVNSSLNIIINPKEPEELKHLEILHNSLLSCTKIEFILGQDIPKLINI